MNDTTNTVTKHGIYYKAEFGGENPAQSGMHQFFVDGVEYSADEVRALKVGVAALEARITTLEALNRNDAAEMRHLRDSFGSAIAELVDDGDLACEVANEVLNNLGLDRLMTPYTARITVTYDVSFESSADPDDLEGYLKDSDYEFSNYSGNLDVTDCSTTVGPIEVSEA